MSAKMIIGVAVTAVTLSLVPLALIARSRATTSPRTAPHLVLDMDKQPRYDPQSKNAMFADGRAMRPQVQGTLAREDLIQESETLTVPGAAPKTVGGTIVMNTPEQYAALVYGRVRAAGMSDGDFNAAKPPEKANDPQQTFYVTKFPAGIVVDHDMLARGQERFNIYCAPCHGESGYGDGMVHRAAMKLQATNVNAVSLWVAPANLTEEKFRTQSVGRIYNTIANGFNNMPAYDKQISVQDRWAIVAYVRALQISQGGTASTDAGK